MFAISEVGFRAKDSDAWKFSDCQHDVRDPSGFASGLPALDYGKPTAASSGDVINRQKPMFQL
jgi:hypothetical protein